MNDTLTLTNAASLASFGDKTWDFRFEYSLIFPFDFSQQKLLRWRLESVHNNNLHPPLVKTLLIQGCCALSIMVQLLPSVFVLNLRVKRPLPRPTLQPMGRNLCEGAYFLWRASSSSLVLHTTSRTYFKTKTYNPQPSTKHVPRAWPYDTLTVTKTVPSYVTICFVPPIRIKNTVAYFHAECETSSYTKTNFPSVQATNHWLFLLSNMHDIPTIVTIIILVPEISVHTKTMQEFSYNTPVKTPFPVSPSIRKLRRPQPPLQQ